MADNLGSALSQISRQISAVNANVVITNQNVQEAQNRIAEAQREIEINRQRVAALAAYVAEFRKEQYNLAALQRAITELVRINQEYAKLFGKYEEVRDNMRGILQATSKNLVKSETVIRIAEELLLATPDYWLSPCVVALSAWLVGDDDWAKRAMDEALSRNASSTALLMALVCRRNNRIKASNAWLMYYLKKQSASSISRGLMLFINAYVNGMFGTPDDSVDEIVNKWIAELAGDGDVNSPKFKAFELKQKEYWKSEFINKKEANVNSVRNKIPTVLKYANDDLNLICEYIDRKNTTPLISNYFDAIINMTIDDKEKAEINKTLDRFLFDLADEIDSREIELNDERKKYQKIKEYKGDEKRAEKEIEAEKAYRARYASPVDFIKLIEESASGNDQSTKNESERKISVKFTKKYIQKGYDEFIDEKATNCPDSVTATVAGIQSQIKGQAEQEQFSGKIKQKYESAKTAELSAVKINGTSIFGIILLAVAVLFTIIAIAKAGGLFVLVAICAIAGIVLFVIGKKKNDAKKNDIVQKYDKATAQAVNTVYVMTKEWQAFLASADSALKVEKYNLMTKF